MWKPPALRTSRTIPERLAYWAENTPDARFLRCGSPWLSYAETYERVEKLAGGLASIGVRKLDRVAVMLPNRLEMALTILALARLGAIQVPINVFLKGEFLRYQLRDCTAGVVIADQSGESAIGRIADSLTGLKHLILVDEAIRDHDAISVHSFSDLMSGVYGVPATDLVPTDLVSIMYTSGTTGLPKGCMLSHGYYMAVPWSWYDVGLLEPEDVLYSAMPLFHTGGGLIYFMCALQGGLAYCIDTEFSASQTMKRVYENGASVILGVAAHGLALLSAPESEYDTHHKLRYCMFIPMPEEAQHAFEARFRVPVTCTGYGQTEANPVTLGGAGEFGSRRASMGKPTSLYEVTIRDESDSSVPSGVVGELCVRPKESEVMFQGYWGKPEATVDTWSNLWHHTGDLASKDDDGYLYFKGRKSDSMRRRGENVSAIEIETAIVRHEAVREVAAYAVPGELGEDDIKVCIVWNDTGAPEPKTFFAFLKDNLPYFAIPSYVDSVEKLPVNATGRVMKYVLQREQISHDWDFAALGLTVDRAERRK